MHSGPPPGLTGCQSSLPALPSPGRRPPPVPPHPQLPQSSGLHLTPRALLASGMVWVRRGRNRRIENSRPLYLAIFPESLPTIIPRFFFQIFIQMGNVGICDTSLIWENLGSRNHAQWLLHKDTYQVQRLLHKGCIKLILIPKFITIFEILPSAHSSVLL